MCPHFEFYLCCLTPSTHARRAFQKRNTYLVKKLDGHQIIHISISIPFAPDLSWWYKGTLLYQLTTMKDFKFFSRNDVYRIFILMFQGLHETELTGRENKYCILGAVCHNFRNKTDKAYGTFPITEIGCRGIASSWAHPSNPKTYRDEIEITL